MTDQQGNHLSPILENHIKNYLIDIDGTVCDDIPNEEPERMINAIPLEGAVDFVNNLYSEGHIITFFTSRTNNLKNITETWLIKNGFNFHSVLYGKPRGGNYHWIDNHVVSASLFKGKFTKLVQVKTDSMQFED
ncbi:MAG: phosphoheptose isomerase [Saprospiraceae bacterium]|nr:phosphoheptose isomerase [Saprospiraceae bacterium]